MRVLVTGATGYLGRHLVPALMAEGHDVTPLGSSDADLTEARCLDGQPSGYDAIWHLAAWTQAGDFCLHHPAEQWIINQKINTNVLEWWRQKQPQAKMIAMGTSCSYAPNLELVEENYLLGDPVEELYAYAMTKRMLLVGLRAMAKQFKMTYLYLVPSTVFGPGYHGQGKQLHFIFDLIRKIHRGMTFGEPVVLWGDGHQKREIIYVEDFVKAALLLARNIKDEVVNVGSGQEFSIRWYAEKISRLVGYDAERIQYDISKYVGVRSKQLCIGKLARLVNGFLPTPTEIALEITVRDYRDSF